MTRHFPPDFLDLLIELNRADAKYLLIGGHAVGFHGRPRATKDFDLWAWPARTTWDVDGVALPVIGRDDLVRNKRAAGRPQDLADVDVLERQAATKKP